MKFSKVWALSLLVILVACGQQQQAPQVYGYELLKLEPQDKTLYQELREHSDLLMVLVQF